MPLLYCFIFTLILIIACIVTAAIVEKNTISKYTYELEKTKKEAEESAKAKDEFLASMSHEIRTPINAILGMNEIILRDTKDEDIISHAKNIEHAGENLLALVNDILDFSKIGSGEMSLIEDEYSVSELIKNIDALIRPRAELKNLIFTTNIEDSLPERLIGDKLRVEQIITNLLTNAVKYTDKGEISLKLNWRRMGQDSIALMMEVQDTGRGIKEKDQDKLFTKFQRLDLDETNTIEGTGLGLTITKTLTDLMHGWIKVESIYGEGSTFTAFITQKAIYGETVGGKTLSSDNDNSNMCQMIVAPDARIMVVDDTPLNLEVVQGLLKETQINIDMAQGGEECIQLAAHNTYHMIFLDARMPHPDGIETLHQLKKMQITCPIIVITADAVNGAKQKYLHEGFDEYIAKPFKLKELLAMIEKFLPSGLIKHININTTHNDLPKWVMKIREINVESGIQMCGDESVYLDTLKHFVQYSSDEINTLQKYAKRDQIAEFTIKIHALKSTAKLIGADQLSQMAFKLEEAGKNNDLVYIHEHTEEALAAYKALVSALAPINQELQQTPKEQIDPDALPMLFKHLLEYTNDFNDEAISSMTNAIKKYAFPGQTQQMFDEFYSAYQNADWSKMQQILSNAVKLV